MQDLWRKFISWVSDTIARPDDPENIKIRKVTMAIVTLLAILINFVWTFAFYRLGLGLPTVVNVIFAILFLSMLILLFSSKWRPVYVQMMLLVTLLYVAAEHITIGGFNTGSQLAWLGLIVPLSSTLLLSRRSTIIWSVVYIIIFALLVAFDERVVELTPDLPENFGSINEILGNITLTLLAVSLMLYLVRQLSQAQDRADALLTSILPRDIADKLKHNSGTIAEAYEEASILFADIVGFTPLSAVLTPEEMIEVLNDIYSHFDALTERYGVQRIRTIGDNYMAAAGVPQRRDDHAQALARVALEMLAYCETIEPVAGRSLLFRIGINSGPLIAGVIASKKPQYDIWGDAVNVASRMESQGLPGKIQVSEQTYQLLKEDFILEPRGTIEVKGKGEMPTWFLTGRTGAGRSL